MGVTAIATIIAIVLIVPNAYAVIETSTEYGSLNVDKEVYEIIPGEQTMIKASGTINDVQGGGRLNFVVILPDGLTDGLHTTPTSEGYYEVFWMLDEESQIGQYTVIATYKSVSLGEITFEIKEKEFSEQELLTARELLDQNKEQTETTIVEPIVEESEEDSLFNQGLVKLNEKKYQDALELFNQAIVNEPNNTEIQDAIKRAEDKIRLNNKCQETSFEISSDFDKYLECCTLEPVRERHECKQDLMERKEGFLKAKTVPIIPEIKHTPTVTTEKIPETVTKNTTQPIKSDGSSTIPIMLLGIGILAVIIFMIKRSQKNMGGLCNVCNIKLGFWYRKDVCRHCLEVKYDKFFMRGNIMSLPKLDEKDLTELKKFGKERIVSLYDKLLEDYTSDNIMTEEEITNLEKISKIFELTPKESKHDEIIYPHKIKNYINKNGKLPILNYDQFEKMGIRLQKDEEYYSSGVAELYEMKAHSRYISGSRGVSIYGFKVGRVQGQRVSEQLPTQKSTGRYIITNKRFYYVSDAYGKMTKIDLNKIMSYDSDPDFVIINTHTRQKPYLFHMSLTNIKTSLIGLEFLLNNHTENNNQKKDQKTTNHNPIDLKKYYNILELNEHASSSEIKTSYRELIKFYHPDKFQTKSIEDQGKANKKSQEILDAYEELKKAGKVN